MNDAAPNGQGAGLARPPADVTFVQPAVLVRITSMLEALVAEANVVTLDLQGCRQLGDVHRRAVDAVSRAVSQDLRDELRSLTPAWPTDRDPTTSEALLAQAQLLGWLTGLIHGIQTAAIAQLVGSEQGPVESAEEAEAAEREQRAHYF